MTAVGQAWAHWVPFEARPNQGVERVKRAYFATPMARNSTPRQGTFAPGRPYLSLLTDLGAARPIWHKGSSQ